MEFGDLMTMHLVGLEVQVGYVLKCLERSIDIPSFELRYKDRSRGDFALAVALVVGGGEVVDYRLYALKLSNEGRVLKSEVFEFADYVGEGMTDDLDEALKRFVAERVAVVRQFWWE